MPGMTPWRWRLLGLGSLGVLLAAWASYGPFLFPTCCHPLVTPFNQAWLLGPLVFWVALLLVVYVRDPGGPMWKLVLVYLAARGAWVLGYVPADIGFTLERLLANVSQVVLGHMALAFPAGRLVGRFDRLFVRFAYAWVIGLTSIWLLFWQPLDGARRNVAGLWPNADVAGLVNAVALLGAPVLAAVALWRLWRRWQAGTPARRRVLTPVVVAMPAALVIIGIWHVADAINRDEIRVALQTPILRLTELILPAGFLIGAVRGFLARGSIADLATELARGVPLGGLTPLLARFLRDPTLELAFPAPDGDGFIYPDGRPFRADDTSAGRTVTPLSRGDEVLALLVHDPALEAESPGLVRAMGSVAQLALANERLSAQVRAQLGEVRASRVRIVEAADAERRRIERDLHDGAQQRLLALAVRLQTAKTTVHGADELIDAATAELHEALADVRGIARGLHPPILTDLGLGPAVDALAERASVPVDVQVADGRYPEPVETAAYFLVSEALTNVERYAGATAATVRIRAASDQLLVEISDDGHGGADARRGSGLRGLRDRVEALGGRLTIESPAGGGTAIRATLPL